MTEREVQQVKPRRDRHVMRHRNAFGIAYWARTVAHVAFGQKG